MLPHCRDSSPVTKHPAMNMGKRQRRALLRLTCLVFTWMGKHRSRAPIVHHTAASTHCVTTRTQWPKQKGGTVRIVAPYLHTATQRTLSQSMSSDELYGFHQHSGCATTGHGHHVVCVRLEERENPVCIHHQRNNGQVRRSKPHHGHTGKKLTALTSFPKTPLVIMDK